MKFVLTLLFMLFLVLSPSSRAIAQGSFAFANAGVQVNQHASKPRLKVRSSQQAAQMAKGRYGGKVLKVQQTKSGYRVKLLKADGHIVSVYVDGVTGRITGGN